MDLLAISIIVLSILLSAMVGVFLVQRFIPNRNLELQVSKAFQKERYEEAVRLVESASKPRSVSDSALLAAGRSYVRLGRLEEAKTSFALLLRRPKLRGSLKVTALREYGDACAKGGGFKEAGSLYLAGLQEAPEDSFLRYNYASALVGMGQLKEARLALRDLLKKNPRLADARMLYAEVLTGLGFYSKALQHYGILDRSGEKIVSYSYAKTLKELKISDRAIQVYRALLKSPIDAVRRSEMILDCAGLYLQTPHFSEALLFIESCLPSMSEEGQRELRYMRAVIHTKRGDEYLGLQEFARLFDEYPDYKDLKIILKRNEDVLAAPVLREYFTSTESSFEQLIVRIMRPGIQIVRRSHEYFLCTHGTKAHAFYRSMAPAPLKIMYDMDTLFSRLCPNAGTLDFWSFHGLADDHFQLNRTEYTMRLRSGDDLVQLVSGTFWEKPVFSRF